MTFAFKGSLVLIVLASGLALGLLWLMLVSFAEGIIKDFGAENPKRCLW